jgi:hypothetical protein
MLRTLSARPQLLVDQQGTRQRDTAVPIGTVGIPGPFGRERVVEALKLQNNPPTPQYPAQVVVDQCDMLLLNPADGSVVGQPGLFIHRLLQATRTRDTRRL